LSRERACVHRRLAVDENAVPVASPRFQPGEPEVEREILLGAGHALETAPLRRGIVRMKLDHDARCGVGLEQQRLALLIFEAVLVGERPLARADRRDGEERE
jgi:hypothetical protein